MKVFYQNKTYDFYCRNSDHSPKPLEYTSHLHYYIELALLKEGKTHVTVDTQAYDVEAGDIIIVFPNQVHRFETIEREKYILMVVNPDIVSEYMRYFTSKVPTCNLVKGAVNNTEISNLAETISQVYRDKIAFRDEILQGYLTAFFGRLLGMIPTKDIDSKAFNSLGVIMNYCINNYANPLSLDTLEKELHISKYYISHVMNDKLNMGFNDYVNSIRVSNACQYLKKTDLSITEISDLVGFNTMRTFNRAFIKQLGLTPSEYRSNKNNLFTRPTES